MPKQILMLARAKKTEALRMATGLTLLDDQVRVAVLGELNADDPEVQVQLESLEFAEVPVEHIRPELPEDQTRLAKWIAASDAVFVV